MLTFWVILYLCTFVHSNCPSGCEGDTSCCEVEPNKFLCCSYTNEKTLKGVVPEKTPYTICPDRLSFCLKGNTCCPMVGGRWGCCEHAQGVCCSDGGHCCPANTTCNAKDGACIPLQDLKLDQPKRRNKKEPPSFEDLLRTQPAGQGSNRPMKSRQSRVPGNSSRHACQAGGSTSCADDTTCCRENTGDWGCCPMKGVSLSLLPQAVLGYTFSFWWWFCLNCCLTSTPSLAYGTSW